MDHNVATGVEDAGELEELAEATDLPTDRGIFDRRRARRVRMVPLSKLDPSRMERCGCRSFVHPLGACVHRRE